MSGSESMEKALEESRPSAYADLVTARISLAMAHRYAGKDADYTKAQIAIAYHLLGGRDVL